MLQWLVDAGIEPELEPSERALLETPLGSLPNRQVIDASWRGEGLAVLCWSLRRFELPAYDRIVDSRQVADTVGFLEAMGRNLLSTASLRPATEIERIAELMLTVHWRLRQYSLDATAMDLVSFARTCSFGPLEAGGSALRGR